MDLSGKCLLSSILAWLTYLAWMVVTALAIGASVMLHRDCHADPFNDRGPRAVQLNPIEHYGVAGPILDMGTTVVGITQFGAVEANPIGATPLGLAPIVAMKIGAEIAAPRSPEYCPQILAGTRSVGFGAAGSNLAVMAGASGWASAGIGVVAAGLVYWLFVRDEAFNECYVEEKITVPADQEEAAIAEFVSARVLARFGPPDRVVIEGWRARN